MFLNLYEGKNVKFLCALNILLTRDEIFCTSFTDVCRALLSHYWSIICRLHLLMIIFISTQGFYLSNNVSVVMTFLKNKRVLFEKMDYFQLLVILKYHKNSYKLRQFRNTWSST